MIYGTGCLFFGTIFLSVETLLIGFIYHEYFLDNKAAWLPRSVTVIEVIIPAKSSSLSQERLDLRIPLAMIVQKSINLSCPTIDAFITMSSLTKEEFEAI